KHPPLALPKEPIHTITPAQFCGYGTGDKNKRAFGLFGGEHETIFPNLRKAMLVYPFFDPSVGALEDDLVKEWEKLGKFPTGRAEPGDSGSPILVKQENGQFITVGVVQGIQFQGDPEALKTASIQEQFENVSTTVAPIVILKKDGLYHLSKTFHEILEVAQEIMKGL
ncbi:MAG: hypothetical protein K2X53_04620, partial [Alphaproteobacteria bacterium]|nr:hypothetical protein [Alphaproteobacteria bacterium]